MRVNTKHAKILNNNVAATKNDTENKNKYNANVEWLTKQSTCNQQHTINVQQLKEEELTCRQKYHKLTWKTEYNTIANGSKYKTTQKYPITI